MIVSRSIWFALVLFSFSAALPAQTINDSPNDFGLSACLSDKGELYNIIQGDVPAAKCNGADIPVFMGTSTIDYVKAGPGINVTDFGDGLQLELDKDVILPPACKPGETVIATSNGWECIREVVSGKPSKVWVLPAWDNDMDSSGIAIGFIDFINPSTEVISVACYFFNSSGNRMSRYTRSFYLSPGQRGLCNTPRTRGASLSGWALVVSSSGIWPHGQQTSAAYRSCGLLCEELVRDQNDFHFYPVDCSDQTGIEFICQFVGHE